MKEWWDRFLSGRKAMEWISVKDRIPMPNQIVLVNTGWPGALPGIGCLNYTSNDETEWDALVVDANRGILAPPLHFRGEALHWMPLPDPPADPADSKAGEQSAKEA